MLVNFSSELRRILKASFNTEDQDSLNEIVLLLEEKIEQKKTEANLREVKLKIKELKTRLKTQKDFEKTLDQSLKLLRKKESEVEELKALADKRRNELRAKIAQVEELLKGTFPVAYLKENVRRMQYLHWCVKSSDRSRFEELRDDFRKVRKTLREKGLKIRAIDIVLDASFNNPRRDGLERIRDLDWYRISEYESE